MAVSQWPRAHTALLLVLSGALLAAAVPGALASTCNGLKFNLAELTTGQCPSCGTAASYVEGKDISNTTTVGVNNLIDFVADNTVDSPACCNKCNQNTACQFWTWELDTGSYECRLFGNYPKGTCPILQDAFGRVGPSNYPVGGSCNPSVAGDPHLIGARGTHFDFNGLPDQSFCLVSDTDFQINMGIGGFYGSPVQLSEVTQKEPVLHTWATGLSVLWLRDGQEHVLVLRTRAGLEASRGAGAFLAEATLDGTPLAPFGMSEPENRTYPELGLTLTFEGAGKYGKGRGAQDTELYSLSVDNYLSLGLRLRPAMKSLWSATDAYIHFDLQLGELNHSPDVHGVLGQTYREGKERDTRASFYQAIGKKIKGNMHVDGPHAAGAGFLDGALEDYRTNGLQDSQCRVSHFNSHIAAQLATWSAPPEAELLARAEALNA